jgi:hypothetical protein
VSPGEGSTTLPGLPSVPPVRDELDRRYTPDPLACAVVRRIRVREFGERVGYYRTTEDGGKVFEHRAVRILEPSVGGGAFARACSNRWPSAHITGVDLELDPRGVHYCSFAVTGISFLHYAPDEPPDLIVGNPPFGEALLHVRHALTFGCPVVFVLPLAYLGVQSWAPLVEQLSTVRPIVGRPWPEHVREVAVYEWGTVAPERLDLITDWRRE